MFISGGYGGVRTFGIQLLRAFAAFEITVTCSGKNVELCRELGATTVIDYTKENHTEKLSDFDLYIDSVRTTDHMRRRGLKVLKSGGHYVTLAFPVIQKNTDQYRVIRCLWKTARWLWANRRYAKKHYNGVQFNMNVFLMAKMGSFYLQEVAYVIDEGKLRPIIHKEYTLDEIRLADE